ncbi:hypothetical protein I6E29_00055 [Arcanobacterium haemolyticum]|nr:hypothetical protein [Arcanobacterium haemolyticum]
MQSIERFVDTGPFFAVFIFLTCAVAFRSSIIYGLGRYAHYLMMRDAQPSSGFALRVWTWAHATPTQKAMATLRSRGWIAIPLCYLTVGVQTLIIMAAGIIGMTYPRFALAAAPGWLAWSAIYSTIGFAVWRATVSAAAGSPLGIAIIAVLIVVIVAVIVWRRRSRVRLAQALTSDE